MVPAESIYPLYRPVLPSVDQSYDDDALQIPGTSQSVHTQLLPAYLLPLSYIQNENIHTYDHILTEVLHTAYQTGVRTGCHVRMGKHSRVPSHGRNEYTY